MQCDQSDIEPISLVRPYMSMAIMISRFGEVAEWSNVPDSKSGMSKGIAGSNPALSAIFYKAPKVFIVASIILF